MHVRITASALGAPISDEKSSSIRAHISFAAAFHPVEHDDVVHAPINQPNDRARLLRARRRLMSRFAGNMYPFV